MIRAIVSGAASPAGAELIRILLHHPDVEITAAVHPRLVQMPLADTVAGLTGDTDMRLSGTYAPADGDVLFLADNEVPDFDIDADDCASLRIIDMTGRLEGHTGFVTGIGELNRKPMVRGARRAAIPDALTVLAVTALLPLAKNRLLESDSIRAVAEGAGPEHASTASGRTTRILASAQPGFTGKVTVTADPSGDGEVRDLGGRVRFNRITVTIPCNVGLRHVTELYDEYFDDHNFVFTINGRIPAPADVVNTNKLLINLTTAPDGTLTVTAACDPVIKGSAGAAVHCMNLLFGLHERTGLNLLPLG